MNPQIKQAKLETLEAIIKEVEGMKIERPGYYVWTQEMYDQAQAGKMADWAKKRKVGEECFSGESEEFGKPYNEALSDLLTKLEAELEIIKKEQ